MVDNVIFRAYFEIFLCKSFLSLSVSNHSRHISFYQVPQDLLHLGKQQYNSGGTMTKKIKAILKNCRETVFLVISYLVLVVESHVLSSSSLKGRKKGICNSIILCLSPTILKYLLTLRKPSTLDILWHIFSYNEIPLAALHNLNIFNKNVFTFLSCHMIIYLNQIQYRRRNKINFFFLQSHP